MDTLSPTPTALPENQALAEINLKGHAKEINYMYYAILGVMAIITAWSMIAEFLPAFTATVGPILGWILVFPIALAIPAFLEFGVVGWWKAREHPKCNTSQKVIAKQMTDLHIRASVGVLVLNFVKIGFIALADSLTVNGVLITQEYVNTNLVVSVLNVILAVVIAYMAYMNITRRKDYRDYDDDVIRDREHARKIQEVQNQIAGLLLDAERAEKIAEATILQENAVLLAQERGVLKAVATLKAFGFDEKEVAKILKRSNVPAPVSQPQPAPAPVEPTPVSQPAPRKGNALRDWYLRATGQATNP